MRIYRVVINKPFDYNDPTGKFKIGDVGIYSKHIDEAIEQFATLEINTPEGLAYADPRKIKKSGKYIFRYYKQPEPMKLYVVTPTYGNKEDFTKEEITGYTGKGIEAMVKAWKLFKHSV